jgi:hypothetical protein
VATLIREEPEIAAGPKLRAPFQTEIADRSVRVTIYRKDVAGGMAGNSRPGPLNFGKYDSFLSF